MSLATAMWTALRDRLKARTVDQAAAETAYVEAFVERKMRLEVIPQMEMYIREAEEILGVKLKRPWEPKPRAPIHCPAGADWRES